MPRPRELGLAEAIAQEGYLLVAMSCSGVEWRAAADEDGHYCFAVAL
jgi:hypothetical protein